MAEKKRHRGSGSDPGRSCRYILLFLFLSRVPTRGVFSRPWEPEAQAGVLGWKASGSFVAALGCVARFTGLFCQIVAGCSCAAFSEIRTVLRCFEQMQWAWQPKGEVSASGGDSSPKRMVHGNPWQQPLKTSLFWRLLVAAFPATRSIFHLFCIRNFSFCPVSEKSLILLNSPQAMSLLPTG